MELKQLESFAAVVRHRNFTRAAEACFSSQPAVSTHVRQLEEELGVRLLNRSTRTVTLTREGEAAYSLTEKLLALKGELEKLGRPEDRRELRLGASTIPSQSLVPELIAAFTALYPEVKISLRQGSSAEILRLLQEESIDAGFIGAPCQEKGIRCREMYRDRLVVIAPADRTEDGGDLQRLLSGPVILREKGSGSRKAGEEVLRYFGLREETLRVAAEIAEQETVKRLVAAGLGAAILSESAVGSGEAGIRVLPLPEGLGSRTINLISRENPRDDTVLAFLRLAENRAETSAEKV